MWLKLDEKIGRKSQPPFQENTLIVSFKLSWDHQRNASISFQNTSDPKTWISGVMMVKMEARGREEGWGGPAASLRVLEKTDAWSRWEEDKKVEGKG